MTSLKLLREIRKMERIAGGARGKKPPKPIENWNIYKGDLVSCSGSLCSRTEPVVSLKVVF